MNRQSRRQFIRGLGQFSLALPVLPSLFTPEQAKAQAMGAIPKRFVAIANFDGYYEPVWFPTVPADTRFAADVYHKPLTSIAGPMSEIFDAKFDALRSKMNIYRGLDMTGAFGHSAANMLTGARREVLGDNNPIDPVGNSRSMDVILTKSKNFYPEAPQFSALRGQEPSYNYSVSFDKDAQGKTIRIPYDLRPNDMFQAVFGNRIADPNVAAAFKAKKLTIGDIVLQDFKAMMNHRRIASEDKNTLDNFVSQLQALNTRINSAPDILSCTTPSLRAMPSPYWGQYSEQDKKNFYSNYIDTMIAAMACGLTSVGVISMRIYGHDHGLSHGNSNDRANQLQYIANTSKIAAVVAELGTKMEAYKEVDGTSMLDNSIVFWGNEAAAGFPHSCISMPAMTMGGAGGKLRTGQYVDYRQRPFIPHLNQPTGIGRSYTQLLITFMKALGLQPSEYMSYGDGGGFGSFSRTHPYSNGAYIPYEAFRNDPLPFISVA